MSRLFLLHLVLGAMAPRRSTAALLRWRNDPSAVMLLDGNVNGSSYDWVFE